MGKVNAEPLFQLDSPFGLSIDGRAAKALKLACDAFAAAGKDLDGFAVRILEEAAGIENEADDVYVVAFIGKLLAGKRGLGTANRVPGSVTYFVSRENWKIIKEQGIK